MGAAFAATFNFLAYFFIGTAVASTIAKTVKSEYAGLAVVFAALFAAIAWNFITWRFGMPSSSSHAIVGGLVGAGLAAGGIAAISWDSVSKAAIGIVLTGSRDHHRDSRHVLDRRDSEALPHGR